MIDLWRMKLEQARSIRSANYLRSPESLFSNSIFCK